MIDKSTDNWNKAPFWVKQGLWGVKSRKVALGFEVGSLLIAFVSLLVSFINPEAIFGVLLFGAAYWYAASIRWVDNAKLW